MRTHMATEIAETPQAVARFLDASAGILADIGARLRALDPPVVLTCARGSSDHAAGFFKYAVEILSGVPVASIGPSVASIYGASLRARGAALLSVSQSGRSPDLAALQRAARQGGALAIAVVNDEASPLATEADVALPLRAGTERSVAATKTCIASAVALAGLQAEWSGDATLSRAVRDLPAALDQALSCDWGAAVPAFESAASAYVVGRGPAYPIASEAALKLKETAVLHAEAFSGAEVMHGPLQLLGDGFPVLAFRQDDASAPAMDRAVARLRAAGGRIFVARSEAAGEDDLPVPTTGHPLLEPLVALLSFYGCAERVARGRGHDPDHPSHLRKVTETI